MRTWILCVSRTEARVYQFNGVQGVIPAGQSLLLADGGGYRRLAEEMELACGAGTTNQLIVCGERGVLQELTGLFSEPVRRSIRGMIPKSLLRSSPAKIAAAILALLRAPVWQPV